MRLVLIIILAAVMMLITTVATANTIYVNADGSGNAITIQGGIDLAGNGDVVVVAAGRYTGFGNYNISYYGKSITVISDSGPFWTTIDCQSLGQAFQFVNGEDFNAVLEGFTIVNGNGVHGGAIYCDGASPSIRFNLLYDNIAWETGGAIHARNGSPTIYNNTFYGNGAQVGGAILLGPQSNAQIWQNLVVGSTSGGAVACLGAGGATFVSCNDLYANAGGDAVCGGISVNNYSLDPLFCGIPGSGNFFLQSTSPCSQSFSPCAAQVGAFDVQCEVTRTQPATWGMVKSLYR
jgi:hypothetical protein